MDQAPSGGRGRVSSLDRDRKLRHASFKGLREEADADAIHELL